MTQDELFALLNLEMDKQKITNNTTRAGIAAICMGESGLLGHVETGYSKTSNTRIREVFGSRVSSLSDAELNTLKANDKTWFNFIYNGANSVGKSLGNIPNTDDGYNFRGRYGIQITGRTNYTLCSKDIGRPEIVTDPDMLSNDPAIGMAMSVAFIQRNYHGNSFDSMMASVGNNTPDIEASKRSYYAKFTASRQFDYVANRASVAPAIAAQPAETPATAPVAISAVVTAAAALKAAVNAAAGPEGIKELQRVVNTPADGNWGPLSTKQLNAYLFS